MSQSTNSISSGKRVLGLTLLVVAVAAVVACTQAAAPPAATTAPKPAAKAAPKAPAAPAKKAPAPKAAAPAPKPKAAAPKPKAAPVDTNPIIIGAHLIQPSFDPHSSRGDSGLTTFRPVFNALTTMGLDGIIQPDIAESWKLIDDTTWQFKLRTGVKYHNGEPFNAEAAKFSIDRLITADPPVSAATLLPTLKSVEVVDSETINIITTAPDPILPNRAVVTWMLPPKYFEEVGPDEFASKPVGTGPYKVAKYETNQLMLLEATQEHFTGPSVTQTLDYNVIPEPAPRAAGLQSGELDVAFQLPADLLPGLRSEGYVVITGAVENMAIVDLNAQIAPELGDRNVRLAMNLAVDKKAVVDNVLGGLGRLEKGQIVADRVYGHDPSVEPMGYDPDQAKALLAEAGYGDGLTIQMSTSPILKDATEAIQGFLLDAGVTMEVEFLDFPTFLGRVLGDRVTPMLFWLNNPGLPMDADPAFDWYLSSRGSPLMVNSKFDDLVAATKTEMNAEKRLDLLHQAGAVWREELPAILLYSTVNVYVTQGNITGFEATPDGGTRYSDLARSN